MSSLDAVKDHIGVTIHCWVLKLLIVFFLEFYLKKIICSFTTEVLLFSHSLKIKNINKSLKCNISSHYFSSDASLQKGLSIHFQSFSNIHLFNIHYNLSKQNTKMTYIREQLIIHSN